MSLFGTIIDNLFASDRQDDQNRFNERMWEKQNAYNTPAAQMSRFMSAGINPGAGANAITGQQNVAGAVASTPVSPTNSSGTISDDIRGIASLKPFIENLKSQTNKNNTEAGEMVRLNDAQIKELESRAEKNYSESERNSEESINMRTFRGQLYDLNKGQIQKLQSSIDLDNQNISYLAALTSKIPHDIEKIDAETSSLNEDVNYKKTLEDLNVASTKAKLQEAEMFKTASILNEVNSYKSYAELKRALSDAVKTDLENLLLRFNIEGKGLINKYFIQHQNDNIPFQDFLENLFSDIQGQISLVLSGFSVTEPPSLTGAIENTRSH